MLLPIRAKEKCSPICCGFDNVQKNKRRVFLFPEKTSILISNQSTSQLVSFSPISSTPLCFFSKRRWKITENNKTGTLSAQNKSAVTEPLFILIYSNKKNDIKFKKKEENLMNVTLLLRWKKHPPRIRNPVYSLYSSQEGGCYLSSRRAWLSNTRLPTHSKAPGPHTVHTQKKSL